VHKVLTRTTYIGRHRSTPSTGKRASANLRGDVVEMAVPRIIDAAEFEVVQILLKSRSPA